MNGIFPFASRILFSKDRADFANSCVETRNQSSLLQYIYTPVHRRRGFGILDFTTSLKDWLAVYADNNLRYSGVNGREFYVGEI